MVMNTIKPESLESQTAAQLYKSFLKGDLQLLGLKNETDVNSMRFSIEHFLHHIPKPQIYAATSIGNSGKVITRVFKGSNYLKGLFLFLGNKTRIRNCVSNSELDNLRVMDIPELNFLWRQEFQICRYEITKRNQKPLHIISLLNPEAEQELSKILNES